MMLPRRIGFWMCVAAASCCGMLLGAPAAGAAPIGCSVDALKTAIDVANANADATTIELPAGCTYTLTALDNNVSGPSGLPVVTTPVTVEGNGATLRRDPTADPMRFFLVQSTEQSTASLTMEDLTLTDGTVAEVGHQGGAISASCDAPQPGLVIRRTAFVFNRAGAAGAIWACGAIAIEDSLFLGNAAGASGAIRVLSPGVITNTTFTANVADNGAGGAVQVDPGVALVMRHATVVGNRASAIAGGVVGAVLQNSIVASNTPTNCGVPMDAQGRNLAFPASDTSCQVAEVSAPTDYVSGDPLLQPLGSYGGPTQSMRPLAGSAAVDAATGANCPPADQRGKPRPVGAACDLGAVESEQDPPTCADAASAGAFGAVQRVALSCSDPSGYPLTYGAVAGPSNGALGAFGDGGVDYTPRTGFSGADAFTFHATNGFAATTATARVSVGAAPPPPPDLRDVTPPDVLDVAVTPSRFAIGDRRTPRIARRPPRRATIRYSLSEPATVALILERRRRGVRVERAGTRRCVAATPRNRAVARGQIAERLAAAPRSRAVRRALRKAACPAFVRRGTLQRTGTAGANRVAFSGRVGSAPLRPGAHRVSVRARDAAGNASLRRSAAFTILRRR